MVAKTQKAKNMKVDSNNHTRWKHKWGEDVGRTRFLRNGLGTKNGATQQTKMSEFDGQEGLRDLCNDEREAVDIWDSSITFAQKVLRCNCVETATWRKNGSTVITHWVKSFRRKLVEFGKHCTHGGKEECVPGGTD